MSFVGANLIGHRSSSPYIIWRKGLLWGIIALLTATLIELVSLTQAGAFNDFDIYWASFRMLAHGHNPYDLSALHQILQSAGSPANLGQGYSYPLFFALVMFPLGLFPLKAAELIFTILSLLALVPICILLINSLPDHTPGWEKLLLSVGLSGFVPVWESLRFGQANLLVLLLLVVAYRGWARWPMLAVASAVKLYPMAGLLAFLPKWRRNFWQLILGGSLFLALALLPNLLLHMGNGIKWSVGQLFISDSFLSNESINSFISRLAWTPQSSPQFLSWDPIAPSPLLPGLPVVPIMLVVAGALGIMALTVVLVVRGEPWAGCLALLLTYASLAASHNSLWNFSPMVLSLFWCWPRVRRRPVELAIFLLGWALIQIQGLLYGSHLILQLSVFSWSWPLVTSMAVFGGLVVLALNAWLLLMRKTIPA